MPRRRLRIAWVGPLPSDAGGVAYLGWQLVESLPHHGVDVECFTVAPRGLVNAASRRLPQSVFVNIDTGWRYDRWYSNSDFTKMATKIGAAAAGQIALGRAIERRHRSRPYDAVYQFSQPELFSLRGRMARLPAVVVHPEVHAAGELRWHGRERTSGLAAHEPAARHYAVRGILATRSRVQRWDLRLADRIVCPSRAFAAELERDYGIDPGRCAVVPNAVDLARFRPPGSPAATGVRRLLFVSRLAVRKGTEMVVDLSHRLRDLFGRVEIVVVGERSLWSDYRQLLSGADQGILSYVGSRSPTELLHLLHGASAVLQPSHYEPFALTVAEGLAAGVPVVVSDAVGAGEDVDEGCCRRFCTGDADAFERAVRELLVDLDADPTGRIGALARREAERRFDVDVIAEQIRDVLTNLR